MNPTTGSTESPDAPAAPALTDGDVTAAIASAGLGRLTIRSIETIPVIVPLQRAYHGSFYKMTNRATVITRVITEEGIIGQAYAGDEDKNLDEIVGIVANEIAPVLVGQDAFASERCWQLAHPVTFDQLRDRKVSLVSLAGVDLAIWDAIGKALSVPLWRLWGGYQSDMPVNIIGGYYGRDPGRLRDELAQWVEMGFRGCKFKIGGLSPDEDAARVRLARETLGEDFVITIDANQGYSLQDALRVCRLVHEYDIRWFEEPCIWSNDHRDMRDVRARGGISVCAGQSEHSPNACRDMMQTGSVDVCNFDASWSGGYTAWKRMAAAAHLYSVELAHHEEPQIATHMLASQPHGTYVEVFHPDRDPIWWNLISNRPELIDGRISLPMGPGFGWVLDTEYVEHHRADQ